MCGLLYQSVSDSILADMKLHTEFDKWRMTADLYQLYAAARLASMGQGEHSMYRDMLQLKELRIVDENFTNYHTEWRACVNRIKTCGKTPEELCDHMFKSFYYIGLIPSDKLGQKLQNIIALPLWHLLMTQ